MAWYEPGSQKLAGILSVRTGVVGTANNDLGTNLALYPLSNIKDRDIFKSSIVAAAGNLRMGQEVSVDICDILNMDVWASLVATEDGDLAVFECLIAEHVHAHIKPHPW